MSRRQRMTVYAAVATAAAVVAAVAVPGVAMAGQAGGTGGTGHRITVGARPATTSAPTPFKRFSSRSTGAHKGASPSNGASAPVMVLSVVQISALTIGLSENFIIPPGGAPVTVTAADEDFGGPGTSVTLMQSLGDGYRYDRPGVYTVSVTATDSLGNTYSASVVASTAGADFAPEGPWRILDTRKGTGAPKARVAPGHELKLQVVGLSEPAALPSTTTAVALNLTATDATGAGYITAFNDGSDLGRPSTSDLNYSAGQTVSNLVLVPVTDGYVDLYNGGSSAGPVDLIADITGYFSPANHDGYTALAPDRLLDTRNGTGAPRAEIPAGGMLVLHVDGLDGGQLPSVGIDGVVLNLAVTDASGTGYIAATAYCCPPYVPGTSSINYVKGRTVSHSVIVPVNGSTGDIALYNGGSSASPVDVVADVDGYFDGLSTSAYVPVAPRRVLDTRGPDGSPLANGDEETFSVYDTGGLGGLSNITGYVMNTTVTDTAGDGFLTVFPAVNPQQFETPPTASALNWARGQTVADLDLAAPGADGWIDLYNGGANGGDAAVIVDVFGYFQNS